MRDEADFGVAKIALICADHVACQQLKDGQHRGQWDLAGGARADDETALECALGHVWQSFGLRISPSRVLAQQSYPSTTHPGDSACFMAAIVTMEESEAMLQVAPGWELMPMAQFINHPDADRQLQHRLAEFVSD